MFFILCKHFNVPNDCIQDELEHMMLCNTALLMDNH